MLLEVEDECGGLPDGTADDLFKPFEQRGTNRRGLGLGLASAAGVSKPTTAGSMREMSRHTGCIFTIDLPRLFEPLRPSDSRASGRTGAICRRTGAADTVSVRCPLVPKISRQPSSTSTDDE
jgi:hypothetical protein